MKQNRADEPIGAREHMHMVASQGNSLCHYLSLK
jgi:hypothetical protein